MGPHGDGPSDRAASTVVSYMVAIGLFFAILIMALSYVGVLTQPATDAGDIDLDSKASNVLKVLTGSPGVPSNWEDDTSSLTRLGLLKPGTSITVSQDKLEALQPGGGVTYQEARAALGLSSHQFRLETQPQFKGDANRTTIDGYRVAYIGKYESGSQSSGSEAESQTLANTSVAFNNTLASEDGVLSSPGDKFQDDSVYVQRHLIPRMAGLWYNDDVGSPSVTAWRVLDNEVHAGVLDPDHRNILATSNWTGSGSDWTYTDGEDDRILAIKVNLSDYGNDDPVWLNMTHAVNGSGSFTTPGDHGEVQSRPVDSPLDTWTDETSWAALDTAGLVENGTEEDFVHGSYRITEARGDNSYIAFLWDTSSTDTNDEGGWFIANWTLEAVHNGQPVVLVNNTLDYNTTNVDALVTGKGVEHGQFSDDAQSQDKDPLQQWIHAGGDLYGMAPENPSSTAWLDPWIRSGGGEDHGPFDIVESRSNTSHSILTNPTNLDWRDWEYTNFHWNLDPDDKFNWVLAASEENGDEIAPVLAVSQPDAPGEGNLVLSSQDTESLGETARQWYLENGLVTLRYRGLFLNLGDEPSGNHTVGSADTVGLVDATEGKLNYPNYELFVDVWR